MKIKTTTLTLLFLMCHPLPAPDVGGHGGGTLPRLLTLARAEIVSSFGAVNPSNVYFGSNKLARWYKTKFETIKNELPSLQLVEVTSRPIRDSFLGYESWIRVTKTLDFVVEYNPEVENYERLVGVINKNHRFFETEEGTPSISDVAEYLLHEIGHRYGLDEQDAWTFAQALAPHFKFNLMAEPRYCTLGRVGDASKTTKIKVSGAYQDFKRVEGGFVITYHFDPEQFLLYVTVEDVVLKRKVFQLKTAANAVLSVGDSEGDLGAWWFNCD